MALQYRAVVGIDPAFRERGFSLCVLTVGRTAHFHTFVSFMAFLSWANTPGNVPDGALFVVENSNLEDTVFARLRGESPKAMMTIARNVGKNQAVSQCTVDYLCATFGEANVQDISPSEKGAKWGMFGGKRNMPLARQIAAEIMKAKKVQGDASRLTGDEIDALQLALKYFR